MLFSETAGVWGITTYLEKGRPFYGLDNAHRDVIIGVQLHNLIKSGGGNGPMKPGNLRETARCQIRRQCS